MTRNRYPRCIPLITGNRRANIEDMEKCMEVGYRLLLGFTTPSRHTSAMSENVRKDNIFVCELSWELYTLDDIEENLKSRRDSQPRDIHDDFGSLSDRIKIYAIAKIYALLKKIWIKTNISLLLHYICNLTCSYQVLIWHYIKWIYNIIYLCFILLIYN